MDKKLEKTIKYLKNKKRVLLLTTSNRWNKSKEIPKSTLLALKIKKELGNKISLLDISKLKIYQCEGNVSNKSGNSCGVKEAILKDKNKNPSGCHRCWASINNKDDELWIVSKKILESDCVIFFTSVRWGQTNSIYQKLIERLTWLENRHSTLKEKNILRDIEAGIIITGQNWNGKKVLETQKEVLKFYGFNLKETLCWNYQYTNNQNTESSESYQKAFKEFNQRFLK